MLDQYENVVLFTLFVLTLGLITAIALIVILFKTVTLLKQENKLIKNESRKLNANNKVLHSSIARILIVVQSGADEIVCLRQQMNQVHQWLGEVLSISNLIRSEEGIDNTTVIEELRQRVKWAEEEEHQRVDDRDYYKGD